MSETAPDREPPSPQERFRKALPSASRWLPASFPPSPAEALASLTAEVNELADPQEWDRYGTRGPVSLLETTVAELPLRDAGYLLPTWDELNEFATAARERGVPLHLDGARLWESQPYLGHGLDEIAGLADSVYVSFYKGLGGLAGAVVAGPQDVVDEARRWRTRHGGTVFTMLPYALSGLRGLRTLLPRMAEFHGRAAELATALENKGFRVFPNPPHTNAFRLYLDRAEAAVNERIVLSLEKEGVALLPPVRAGEMPGTSWAEFSVGAATMEWDVEEAAEALARLLG